MNIGEYNTERPGIKLKEYGRNVQKLVDFIRTIPDKEKRTAGRSRMENGATRSTCGYPMVPAGSASSSC